MKKLIAICFCIAMLITAGCRVLEYQHDIIDPTTNKIVGTIKVKENVAMAQTHTGMVWIKLADGTELMAWEIDMNDSPESARQIGLAVANGMSGGMANVGENLTNKNK